MAQQKTIPLPSTHPLRNLVGLARQIALPHEYEPERFPSFPALERTAKLGFNQPTSLEVPASTERKVALFRQAAYPLWAEKTLTSSHGYTVTYESAAAYGNNSGAIQEMYNLTFDKRVQTWSNTNVTATQGTLGVSGQPSTGNVFSYAIMGVDSGCGPQPFVYLPPGAGAYMVIRTTATDSAWQPGITLEIWDAPGEVHTTAVDVGQVTTNTGKFFSVPSNVSGWIRPILAMVSCTGVFQSFVYVDFIVTVGTASYTESTTTAGTVNLVSATRTPFIPLVVPAEFTNSQLPWYSTRVTAAACLATNVTTVLNKGGTVLAGRLPPSVINPWSVTSANINLLHPAEKAYLPLETGLYTYCPPSTDLTTFWDYTLNIKSNPAEASFPAIAPIHRLDNDSLVNYAFISTPAFAASLALNVDWHVEFRTSSALFDVGMSTVTLETLHQAQIILAAAGFFFENPDHKAILAMIMKALKDYGPSIATLARVAGYTADMILSKKPQGGMVATSVIPHESSVPSRVSEAQPSVKAARRRRKAERRAAKLAATSVEQKKKGGLQMYLDSKKQK